MTNWVWSGVAFNSSNDPSWSNPGNWQGDVVPTIAVGDTVALAPVGYLIYAGAGFENVSNVANFSGSLSNGGTITLGTYSYFVQGNTYYYGFALNFSGNATLNGGGAIIMQSSANATSVITGGSAASPVTLENVNNTIEGGGALGSPNGDFLITNDTGGTIEQTGSTVPLTFQTRKLVNSGLIEATGAAGINFSFNNVGSEIIDQSGGGTLFANGANFNFNGNVGVGSIIGGTLKSANGGQFVDVGGLDGTGALPVAIDAGAIVNIVNSQISFDFVAGANQTGQIDNSGSIILSGSPVTTFGSGSASMIKLYGGGSVTDINDTIGARFNGSSTLENVDNTIVAGGTNPNSAAPGFAFYVTLINDAKGVIEQTSANILCLGDANTHEQVTNSGLIEATGAGGIIAFATINQSGGGTLLADGGDIYIQSADIIGGTVTSENGSAIALNGNLTLDGVTNGALTVSEGTQIEALGGPGTEESIQLAASSGQTSSIVNQGKITLDTGNQVGIYGLVIGSGDSSGATVKLSGGGVIALESSYINGTTKSAAITLENVNNSIEGSGLIRSYYGSFDLDNDAGGIIDANIAGQTLTVQTGNTVANNGTLEADAGVLDVTDVVTGAGSALVTAGGQLTFASTYSQNVAFSGAGALALAQSYGGTLSGFGKSDTIDLGFVTYASGDYGVFTANAQATGGALAIYTSGGTKLTTLALSGGYGSGNFTLGADSGSGLLVGFAAGKFYYSPGVHSLTGDGTSEFVATNFSSADVSVTVDAQGNVVLLDGLGDDDTLVGFQKIDLSDSTIAIAGNVLTQTFTDGTKTVSTFNITGQSYTTSVLSYDAHGLLTDGLFSGITGQGNLSSYENLYFNGNLLATDQFYTGITGQSYTAEEKDYSGGALTRDVFSGVTGQPYSTFENDFVAGVYSGTQYTFSTGPISSAYFYYIDLQDASHAFAGLQLYFQNIPGQNYTSEEEDLDKNGQLSRIVQSGIAGQPYSALEYNYNAGVYAGVDVFYTTLSGAYSGLEVDVSASGQLDKIIYSGLTSTPYSSLEQDFSGGAVTASIYTFDNVTGSSYNSYVQTDSGAGASLQETVFYNSGAHGIIAETGGQTLTSLGDDIMTGSGATNFVFNGIYGPDTITNFAAGDTIALPVAEFANFTAMLNNAQNVGSGVVITAADGDTLTLANMTKATLTGMGASFSFHG